VAKKRRILPRHRRVKHPPRMRLTERDIQMVLAVHEHRTLRADQVQRLFFPSRNTANERLKRLYQHRFLQRRWLPVEYGRGMGQAIYLLGRRGADLVAEQQGIEAEAVGWRGARNRVGALFLEHHLMLNDVRIALTQAAKTVGYLVETWVEDEAFRAKADHVYVQAGRSGRQRVAIIPDAYCVVNQGDKRAHFFVEVDRATLSGRRWRQRVRAYLAYTLGGGYTRRFRTRSLRILTVTTSDKRLTNLRRATEEAGGGSLYWFSTCDRLESADALQSPIWQVAGQSAMTALEERRRSEPPARRVTL